MNKNNKTLFNSHLTLDGFNEARSLTIMQGDKTDLEFILKDKNSEPIVLEQISGQAQMVDSERDTLVAVFNVDVEGSKATFSIDKVLPPSEYEIYIKIGDYYFPSREDSFVIRVIESYDVVSDIDVENVQTIDIVVDALRADIIEALKPEVGSYVDQILVSEPERFKGEKGDKFTIHDFTEEEFNSLRGSDGQPFVFENFTTEQLNDLRLTIVSSVIDEDGNTTVTFNDGSTLIIPKGVQGERGLDGDSVTFESLTPEQKSELTGHQGLSAYQVAVQEGFVGSEFEWLESLKGQDGTNGTDGKSFDYDSLSPEQKLEIKGDKGDKGEALTWADLTQEQIDALRGDAGQDFTYDMFTPAQLEALKGDKGDQGIQGEKGEDFKYIDFTPEQLAALKGTDGNSIQVSAVTEDYLGEDGAPQQRIVGYEISVISPDGSVLTTNTLYHGKNLKFEDLMPDQVEQLKLKVSSYTIDEAGNTVITFSDGSTVTVAKGEKGEAGINGLHGNTTSIENNEDGSYDIVVTNPNSETEISRATVRDGVDGTNGADGENLKYEDLTPEQIAELQEGLPVRPPKIYTRAEYDALDSYDPHTLYFVVEEDEIPQ